MMKVSIFRSGVAVLLSVVILNTTIFPQTQLERQRYGRQDFPRSGEKYITDEFGVIRMWVNVWGHVNKPGSHMVYDGIDLVTLLSVAGGNKTGANLKKVRIFRKEPDKNGKMMYVINMEKFLKTGDRSDFVEVLPNDTYIIPQKVSSFVLSRAGLFNTFLSMVNIYLQILIYSQRI